MQDLQQLLPEPFAHAIHKHHLTGIDCAVHFRKALMVLGNNVCDVTRMRSGILTGTPCIEICPLIGRCHIPRRFREKTDTTGEFTDVGHIDNSIGGVAFFQRPAEIEGDLVHGLPGTR